MHIFVCRKCDKIVHSAGSDAPSCCYCGGYTVPYEAPDAPKRPKVVYICAPAQIDVRAICKRAALQGMIPIAPSLYCPQFLDGRHPWEYRVSREMVWPLLDLCDALFYVGDQITPEMQQQIAVARNRRIQIQQIEA